MNMPGFTAEVSLSRAPERYYGIAEYFEDIDRTIHLACFWEYEIGCLAFKKAKAIRACRRWVLANLCL
jgi:hypothetical protein